MIFHLVRITFLLKINLGAGEVTRSVRCLPSMFQHPIFQHPMKTGLMAHSCCSIESRRDQKSWSFSWYFEPSSNTRAYLKKKIFFKDYKINLNKKEMT